MNTLTACVHPQSRETLAEIRHVCMHAGAETDPSDTINEIIFSTRKVRRPQSSPALCTCSLATRWTGPPGSVVMAED